MDDIIRLDQISMEFKRRWTGTPGEKSFYALREVDLSVNEGEIVVLVGESGCGKTTIGKIITGLLRPSAGKLSYRGKDVYRQSGKEFDDYRRGVQFVQQDSYAALNPARTIFQSLSAPIKTHDRTLSREDIRKKIDDIMRLVGLNPPEQFLSKYPHQLSGGQRQRLLIARAISLDPKLIVTDEPVSMIDVSLRISILNLMADLNQNLGIAFVYITHDLATARYIGNNGRICVMYLGEIVESGPLNRLLYQPRHPYTQALLSAVPIPDPEIARVRRELPLRESGAGELRRTQTGCCFYDRCIYADEGCRTRRPEAVEVEGVRVMCKNQEKVPKWEIKTV